MEAVNSRVRPRARQIRRVRLARPHKNKRRAVVSKNKLIGRGSTKRETDFLSKKSIFCLPLLNFNILPLYFIEHDIGRVSMSQKKQAGGADQAKAGGKPANKWQEIVEESANLPEEEASEEASLGAIDELSKEKLTTITNELEQELDKYKNEALRAKAELENVRRRLERDVSKAHKYGTERLVVDLLPVIDSLVRGLEESAVDEADTKVVALRKGMELTLDILHKTLEKNGVSEINPQKGDVFDPSQHEAMGMHKDPEAKPNTILQVLQRGYTLHGRVIRAAMVMVAS